MLGKPKETLRTWFFGQKEQLSWVGWVVLFGVDSQIWFISVFFLGGSCEEKTSAHKRKHRKFNKTCQLPGSFGLGRIKMSPKLPGVSWTTWEDSKSSSEKRAPGCLLGCPGKEVRING